MRYRDLLLSDEWIAYTREIHKLDGNRCFRCGWTNKSLHEHGLALHVHHFKYLDNDGKRLMPWEYPHQFCVSLCPTCHKALHSYWKKNENDFWFQRCWKKRRSNAVEDAISSKFVDDNDFYELDEYEQCEIINAELDKRGLYWMKQYPEEDE